jgi:outer membrane protein OmpA-like peptidoglycan-associated protein
MSPSSSITKSILKVIVIVILSILFNILYIYTSFSQDYQTARKSYYRAYYRKQIMLQSNACDLLQKKRNKKVRQPLITFKHKPVRQSQAEVDNTTMVAHATPKKAETKPVEKPATRPSSITAKIEHVSPEKIEELHKREEEVLAENNLPKTTSETQALVRKKVADKIASKTNVYPLSVDPLYFNFAEDEFSVVDMEPFLLAAEYAIQGRTVLIEGHTDNKGKDDYNVNLSIKRVQKIRQLMLDMGVPDDRISVVGYGEEIGASSNSTEDARQRNRRVDFTIF